MVYPEDVKMSPTKKFLYLVKQMTSYSSMEATFLAIAWGAWWDATMPDVTELCMNLEFIFTIF